MIERSIGDRVVISAPSWMAATELAGRVVGVGRGGCIVQVDRGAEFFRPDSEVFDAFSDGSEP